MTTSSRACLLACALALGLLGHLLWTVTGGLEHWTFESLRRAQARRGDRQAAPLALRDSADLVFHAWRPEAGNDRHDMLIVDFIFTRCPTVCQSLGSTYQQLQAQLEAGGSPEDARIGLLSISFDTEHDDAAALAEYGRLHRALPARWRLAVPRDAAAARMLLDSLGVVVIADGWGGYTHNAALHLIDRRGRLRAIHDHADWARALDEARRLVREEPR